MVYSLIKDLKTQKSKKHDHIKFWLFYIEARKGLVGNKFELSKNSKAYLIFLLLLLKLVDLEIFIQDILYYQL